MDKKTLNLTLMVMFFFITTALILALFSGSKDTRSRATSGEFGVPGVRITPTSAIRPTIKSFAK